MVEGRLCLVGAVEEELAAGLVARLKGSFAKVLAKGEVASVGSDVVGLSDLVVGTGFDVVVEVVVIMEMFVWP